MNSFSWRRYQSVLLSITLIALADIPPASPAQETSEERPVDETAVAAVVNGETITEGHVERVLSQTVGDLNLNPDQAQRARSAVLETLINQRIVFDFLDQHQATVGEDEVRLKLEDLKSRLATVEETIDDYLNRTDRTIAELKFELAWRSSWNPYLEKKLTDDVLKSHFEQYRRKFDGTELRVAHLLLKPAPGKPDSSRQKMEKLKQSAGEIRSNLTSQDLTWETAVAKHSAAPTRHAGGEIGWINIDGPMPDVFTSAAFKLDVGEISQPVETAFGVHLIKCLEAKQGKLGWRDTIEVVKEAAARTYFDSIVKKHRPEMTIQYGASLRPGN